MVSPTPERFADVGLPEGPFASMANTTEGVRALIERAMSPAPNCASSQRDFVPEGNACASSYGAGLAAVREVE